MFNRPHNVWFSLPLALLVGCGEAEPGTDASAADSATAETAGADAAPTDTAGATDAGADTAPADTAPADTAPVDAAPVDAAPVDTAPADGTVADTADAGPADTNYPDVPTDVVVSTVILPGPSKGSAMALAPNDEVAVVCNRDAGSVSVFSLTFVAGAPALAKKIGDVDLGAGSEPWQAVVSPDSKSAWVVLRRDQKLVQIKDLSSKPAKGAEVVVGSEPTSVALSPTGKFALVANFNDGTLTVVETSAAVALTSIDLNAALVATGTVGTIKPRPGLAHPRSIVITNDGDNEDTDEVALVTEFFAQRAVPDAADGLNADTAKKGLVYRIAFDTLITNAKVTAIDLPPVADLGFKDQNDGVAGCFPNQLQAIAVNGPFAYVTSICASPKGPIGPTLGPANAVCAKDADCPGAAAGACASLKCKTNCSADADCGKNGGKCTANVCDPNPASVKTAIGNVISIIDLASNKEVGAFNLNAKFRDYYVGKKTTDDNNQRYPLVMSDIAFVSGTNIGNG